MMNTIAITLGAAISRIWITCGACIYATTTETVDGFMPKLVQRCADRTADASSSRQLYTTIMRALAPCDLGRRNFLPSGETSKLACDGLNSKLPSNNVRRSVTSNAGV